MSSTRMPCKLIARECQLLMGIITSPNQTLEQTDLQLVTKHSRTRRSRTRHSVTQFQFQYIYFKRNRVHNYNKITIIMHNHISRTPGTNLLPQFWHCYRCNQVASITLHTCVTYSKQPSNIRQTWMAGGRSTITE